MRGREVCACGEPVRAPGQWFCRVCQTKADLESSRKRREELKRLRVEVKELRKAIRAVRKALVAVPDEEC